LPTSTLFPYTTLFRSVYYREVRLDEIIHVDVELTKLNTSNARFSFRHIVYKADRTKSAVVSVDGAWLDLTTRKLTNIPQDWYSILERIRKADDYEEVVA